MEDVEELVNKICEKNNYDELLLEIVKKGKESNINRVLEEISNNTKLNDKEKVIDTTREQFYKMILNIHPLIIYHMSRMQQIQAGHGRLLVWCAIVSQTNPAYEYL